MAAYKLQIVPYQDGFEIIGNREGLQWLADVCAGLSQLSLEEARTAANHYHLADYLNSAGEGSVPVIIRFQPDL